MADLTVGGTALTNQRIQPAEGSRVPAVGTDPEGATQNPAAETTAFQRLSAAEKTAFDVLAELRQKGTELAKVYENEAAVKALTENANSGDNSKVSNAQQIQETEESRQQRLAIIAGEDGVQTAPARELQAPADTAAQRDARLEALAGGRQTASVEFGPEEALREAKLQQEARELEQAILEVSKLADESGIEQNNGVAGRNLKGYIATLNALRVAAQSPDTNLEVARQTREDILQNAQLAALSYASISKDLAEATLK